MAYISPEYLKTLQTRSEFKFFKVLDSSGKFIINSLDTDIGLDSSINLLQETLENIQADYVIVKLYQNKPEKVDTAATNQTKVLTLKVKLEGAANSSLGFPGKQFTAPSNTVSLNQHLDLISENQDLKFKIYKLEKEKQTLEKEIEDLENEEPQKTTLQTALDHPLVSQIGGLLMAKLQPNSATIGEPNLDADFQNAINSISTFEDGKKTIIIISKLGSSTWSNMILPPLKEKLSSFYGS